MYTPNDPLRITTVTVLKLVTRSSLQLGLIFAALAFACFAFSPTVGKADTNATKDDGAARARVSQTYGKLPLSFEANEGQQDTQVKFLSRGSGYNLFLTNEEAVLVLTASENRKTAFANKGTVSQKQRRQSTTLRTKLVAANRAATVTGEDELPGRINYCIGSDSTKWRNNVVTYAKVRYEQVYPGIDLVYYGNQRQLEYDFVVAPGADAARIRLSVAGARNIRVDRQGQLVVGTACGALRWNKPTIYQEVGGTRRAVKGKYVLRRGREIGFQVAAYDTAKPLVIDPTLVYSTYLGGSSPDIGYGIAVDVSGNAYVTGRTDSNPFPITAGAFQTTNGGLDAFVTKLNPTGTTLVYSTYLGGTGEDVGHAIAVGASGNAYVTGFTSSRNFPTTAGAFRTTNASQVNGSRDAFVTQLNPTGTALLYSTYLGGGVGYGIAVDASGNAYVTGNTGPGFPTTAGAFQSTYNPGRNGVEGFVTKLNSTGTGLVYSTYLGSSGDDEGRGIGVDAFGNAYIAGFTSGGDFPTTAGAFQTAKNDGIDAFVTQLNSAGTGLVYSTYLGGSSHDYGLGIAVDASGNAYVTGYTYGTNPPLFPTTVGALQIQQGAIDAFVTKLNAVGTVLYSTNLGGRSDDGGWGIAADAAGNAYVTGFTTSSNFPTTAGAFQTTNGSQLNGTQDAFLTQLNPTGTLLYSTYLGGTDHEHGWGIAVDASGNAYVTGVTSSTNFPTTAGVFQSTRNGGSDGFVAKIGAAATPTPTPNSAPVANPQSVTTNEDNAKAITLTGSDPDGDVLTYAITSNPSHGTLSGTAPSVTYTPNADYNGSDSFAFKVNDGKIDSASATVSITVSAVNDAPIANSQSVTMDEDTAKAITLTASDADGNGLTYSVTGPSHGALSGTAPNLTYTPNANYNGTDSFTFRVNDGTINSSDATISITVSPVNDAPVANSQSFTTDEDTAEAITLTGSDIDGDALTYSITNDPSDGTVSGTPPNVTYTPNSNFNGTDSFTFKVNDGTIDSAETTISITVSLVNDAPVADSQSVTANEDAAKGITLSGSDVDGDTLTYNIVTGPSQGALSGTAPNLTYTPNANYNGPDSFTFKVNDGTVDSASATVSITVSPVNDAPVADPQSVTTNEDAAKAIVLTGSDIDGDTLSYSIASSPSHGALSGTPPNVTYTPTSNYNGSDSFMFKVNDGTVDSAAATVSIMVSPVNDAPVADSQLVTTNEDTAKAITLSGSDVDGDGLTYIITGSPSHGALSGTPPNLTYTPSANYNGSDTIKFKVNDGTIDSAVATVSITVSPVNDAPVAASQSVTTNQDTAKAITLTGSDVDGDALSFTITNNPSHGALSGTPPNVTYTPSVNYNGSDSFAFKVNDGTVASAAATVSITVNLRYTFGGFLQPIDTNMVNSANAGQTIPVKWRLTDGNGAPISDPTSFVSLTSSATPGGCGGSADAIETYAGATATGLQYLGDGVWQFNWKTPKTYAGQCRTMSLNLKDGVSTRTASFTFK